MSDVYESTLMDSSPPKSSHLFRNTVFLTCESTNLQTALILARHAPHAAFVHLFHFHHRYAFGGASDDRMWAPKHVNTIPVTRYRRGGVRRSPGHVRNDLSRVPQRHHHLTVCVLGSFGPTALHSSWWDYWKRRPVAVMLLPTRPPVMSLSASLVSIWWFALTLNTAYFRRVYFDWGEIARRVLFFGCGVDLACFRLYSYVKMKRKFSFQIQQYQKLVKNSQNNNIISVVHSVLK